MRFIPQPTVLIIAALCAAGCGATGGTEDPTPEGRTFVSVNVEGDQIPGGGPLVVGFDDGQISAFAGCNRGAGAVELADGVLVTRLAMTMMACPPPMDGADVWMVKLLDAHPRWTLSGDTLTLSTDALTVTLQDKKIVDPDRSLTDTAWLVNSTISTDAITTSLALEQAAPTLTIAADGAVSGWTGCNRFTGRADLSGAPDVIDFGPVATTKMACPEGLGEIEQAVVRVLDGPVRAGIDGDQLRLERDDGYGLILRAETE